MRQLNEIKSCLTAIRKLNRSKDDPRVENAVDSFEEELLGLQSEDNRLAKAIKKATQSDDRFEFEKTILLKDDVESQADDLLFRVKELQDGLKSDKKILNRLKKIPQNIEENSDEWSLNSIIIKVLRSVYQIFVMTIDLATSYLPSKDKDKDEEV